MSKGFTIAIDGPVASGKGTIAARLAHELEGFDLYTGAMYRAVALFCIDQKIDINKPSEVIKVLPQLKINFENNSIFLNGSNVTDRIKKEDTAHGASVIATYPQVRKYLVERQRDIGSERTSKGQPVIAEGRDTGTVVFPQADLKVYLTASPEVRAKRRLAQYRKQGRSAEISHILSEIHLRDNRDSQRESDPLTSDPKKLGYFILDNSDMNEMQTIDAIKNELKKRGLIQ